MDKPVDISESLGEDLFAKTMLDALPCGLLVVDLEGRVMAVNRIFESVFGVSGPKVLNKGFGSALCCLHACGHAEKCGLGEFCQNCEVRNLALSSLANNQVQKGRTYLQISLDGQVKDANLVFIAAPFTFGNSHYCLLVIEDLNELKAICPPDVGDGFRGIVAKDPKMLALFDTVKQVAQTDAPALIQGESGTGKELVALAIHKESQRAHGNFVPVNCGALPEGLLESELFGHLKGSFTGASFSKRGRFNIADGGSIFLDEVSELSPAVQVKLLRVLQDGCFEQLGSEKTLHVNVRVISATNSDLQREVQRGRFRKDLFYRLCVMPVFLPALRDRKMDIELLSEHFLRLFSERMWRPKPKLSSEALSIMKSHRWPGNVRELQNVIQYALVKCQVDFIQPKDLPPTITSRETPLPVVRHREPRLRNGDVDEALQRQRGNKRKAAKVLGVSRSTLYRFLEKRKL